METYIALSAMIFIMALIFLAGNILQYLFVWMQRNSKVLHHSVHVTKKLKSIAIKIDASIIASTLLFSHQWLIMNVVV